MSYKTSYVCYESFLKCRICECSFKEVVKDLKLFKIKIFNCPRCNNIISIMKSYKDSERKEFKFNIEIKINREKKKND